MNLTLIGGSIATVLASGVVAAFVAGAFSKRSDRLTRRHEALNSARDELAALLTGYRSQGTTAPELWVLEENFLASIDKATYKDLRARAKKLVESCRLYRARDPLFSLSTLEVDRERVSDLLAARLKKVN